jgi:hypothetical protein
MGASQTTSVSTKELDGDSGTVAKKKRKGMDLSFVAALDGMAW